MMLEVVLQRGTAVDLGTIAYNALRRVGGSAPDTVREIGAYNFHRAYRNNQGGLP
jgi:hypothetical protein